MSDFMIDIGWPVLELIGIFGVFEYARRKSKPTARGSGQAVSSHEMDTPAK